MSNLLLSPPIAFLIYIILVALLNRWGQRQAPVGIWTEARVTTYASGEEGPTVTAVPGYRRFFVTALFFAVLHLGVLVLSSGQLSVASGIYAFGLILTLLALILA